MKLLSVIMLHSSKRYSRLLRTASFFLLHFCVLYELIVHASVMNCYAHMEKECAYSCTLYAGMLLAAFFSHAYALHVL